MKQLRIILQSKLFIISIILVTISYVFIKVKVISYKSVYNGSEKEFVGTIISIKESNYGYSLIVNCKEKLLVYTKNLSFELGDKVLIKGYLETPNNNTIFNNFNYKEYLYNQQIFYTINVDKIILLEKNNNLFYKIKNTLYKYIDNFKSKNYLKTFLFADISYLDDNLYQSYQTNGIAHLLSIGSMHITLLSFLILNILKKIKIKKTISKIIFFIIIYFYLILTNYPIAIVRIFIYLILSFINKKSKLNLNSIMIFIFTITITLFINPFYIYNKGFLYSYSISFALMLNKNILNGNYLKRILKVSIISFICSIPFNIYFNYSINLLSIMYNLIFVPIFNIIIFPMSFLTLFLPFLDDIYFNLVNTVNNLSFLLNNLTIGTIVLKKINIFMLIIYLIVVFYIINNIFNRKIKSLILLIIILTIHYNINYLIKFNYIVFLDVNQGDSSLIYYDNNTTLIDTGGLYNRNISENIIIMLKSFGIKKINNLVITHGDFDHMGEAINLVNSFKVEKVIFNCGSYNDLEKELIKVIDKKKIKYYSCIKELNIDNNKIYFLQTKEYDNENDNSNVIYTELDGYKFMFMGDAGKTREKDILEKYNINNIDVLKVGHHGSKTSSSKEFIDEINPKYSIISVGKNNRYGHPNKEVLNNLEESKIYRTDQDGSIMFKIKNNKLKIETYTP